ncbi:MAG: hypothetical protein ABW123_03630 [Cystobacter sp.]
MMKRNPLCLPVGLLMSGLVLGCGAMPGEPGAVGDEPLGTDASAMCLGLSVSNLTFSGMSSWGGDLVGQGAWAVASTANAVRLEYRIDGVWHGDAELTGRSGTWYLSRGGTTCGSHTVEVKAFPMVIDSAGNRILCGESPRTITQTVDQGCPTAALTCTASGNNVTCTAAGSGGTGGPYTFSWQEEQIDPMGGQYTSPWMPGTATNGFYCAPLRTRDEMLRYIMRVKVRDNSGMESSARMSVRNCGY